MNRGKIACLPYAQICVTSCQSLYKPHLSDVLGLKIHFMCQPIQHIPRNPIKGCRHGICRRNLKPTKPWPYIMPFPCHNVNHMMLYSELGTELCKSGIKVYSKQIMTRWLATRSSLNNWIYNWSYCNVLLWIKWFSWHKFIINNHTKP